MTILTPDVIYQSADFRLTDPTTRKPFTDPSPKTITLTYFDWEGFVTYTGVGKWGKRDTSSFVAEWLTGVDRPSMADIAAIIQKKGTEFLRTIERITAERYMHTFTLAGFHEGAPHAYVISNFEDCFGTSRSSVDDHLTTTSRILSSGDKSTVIVTGCKPAVLRTERRTLGMVATKYPAEGLRLRRRIADLNAKAARRSKGTVSEECVVLSFHADGSGASLISGETDQTPRDFPHIMNGIDSNKMISEALKNSGIDLSKAHIVQSVYASSRRGPGSTRASSSCRYSVQTPESGNKYRVQEIRHDEFEVFSGTAITDRGEIVGTGRAGFGSEHPQNIPWRYVSGRVERLSYSGLATGMNNEGSVSAVLQGASARPPSWQRAAVYIGGTLYDLPLYHSEDEIPNRSDSSVRSISESSLMVGNIAVQYQQAGPLIELAAAFGIDGTIKTFEFFGTAKTSRAASINKNDLVLVWLEVERFDSRTVIWDPSRDSWEYVGDPSKNVIPIAFNDNGVVLGQAKNDRNENFAVVCRPGEDWVLLGTKGDWIPIDINNSGQVLGRTTIDHLNRPWLCEPSGQIRMLPFLSDHHTSGNSLNNIGQVTGDASADKDHHVLLWSVE